MSVLRCAKRLQRRSPLLRSASRPHGSFWAQCSRSTPWASDLLHLPVMRRHKCLSISLLSGTAAAWLRGLIAPAAVLVTAGKGPPSTFCVWAVTRSDRHQEIDKPHADIKAADWLPTAWCTHTPAVHPCCCRVLILMLPILRCKFWLLCLPHSSTSRWH